MDRIKPRSSPIPILLLLFSLLHLFLLHPPAQAATVAITNSGVSNWNGGGASSNQNGNADVSERMSEAGAIAARNSRLRALFQSASPSMMGMMVVVCEGLQPFSSECTRIPRFYDYMSDDESSFSAGKKRKRRFASNSFSNWFGSNSAFGPSYSNSGFNFDSWPSFGSNNYGSSSNNNNHNNNNYNNNNHNNNNNPYGSGHSNNHSNIFNHNNNNNNNNDYGSSSGHYGGGGSNTVLCHSQTNQSAIYRFSNESSSYPAAAISAELAANQTLRECLFLQMVLPNDPPALVEDKLHKFCSNCKDKHPSNNLRRKLCITGYVQESVWSYCPLRPQGQRIIRDRIIVPTSCTCQSVLCEQDTKWK